MPSHLAILPLDRIGKGSDGSAVHATITSKRQVTFPAAVLEALGVGPGDRIEIVPSAEGYLLRPKRVDHGKLAPLRKALKPTLIATFVGVVATGILLVGYVFNWVL